MVPEYKQDDFKRGWEGHNPKADHLPTLSRRCQMRLGSKVFSCGSSSAKLIIQSLDSLFRDEACKRLAGLLSTILDRFDILLIEGMPQRHPWPRYFRDKAAPVDAAICAVKDDNPESLLILRSYVLLIYLRVL